MRDEFENKVSVWKEGFDAGYKQGEREAVERMHKNGRRVEWFKLFLLIVIGTFVGHFLWALIAVATNSLCPSPKNSLMRLKRL